MLSYREKYFKYKTKYLQLKNLKGGNGDEILAPNELKARMMSLEMKKLSDDVAKIEETRHTLKEGIASMYDEKKRKLRRNYIQTTKKIAIIEEELDAVEKQLGYIERVLSNPVGLTPDKIKFYEEQIENLSEKQYTLQDYIGTKELETDALTDSTSLLNFLLEPIKKYVKLSECKINENGVIEINLSDFIKSLYMEKKTMPKELLDADIELNKKMTHLIQNLPKSPIKIVIIDCVNYIGCATHLMFYISNISNMKQLIFYNNLVVDDEHFFTNSNLEELKISNVNNNILPSCIFKLKKLKKLDLSWTIFNTIPDSISQLKQLEILNLNNTTVNEISEKIGDLSNLRELHLCGAGSLSQLPLSLCNLTNLEVLDLGYTDFEDELPECFTGKLNNTIFEGRVTNFYCKNGIFNRQTQRAQRDILKILAQTK